MDITFSPTFAWMLIIFGGVFFCIGILFLMPFLPRQNILLAFGIMAASVGGIIGGRVWLRNLPVVMRLTAEGLEVPRKKMTYLWDDIAQVAVKDVYVNGQVSYLCIRLTPQSKEKYDIQPDSMISKVLKTIGGDFDLVFNDQEFSMAAIRLKREIENRIKTIT